MVATWEEYCELSQDKTTCGWGGSLPDFGVTVTCEACHKLRTAGDIARCRIRGGPRIEGLGDVISKVTHATGIAQTVDTVAQFFNADCGCLKRQDALNKVLPIGNDPPEP